MKEGKNDEREKATSSVLENFPLGKNDLTSLYPPAPKDTKRKGCPKEIQTGTKRLPGEARQNSPQGASQDAVHL